MTTVYVVEICAIDGGGFEGVFSTKEKAQQWIDEEPPHKFISWTIVPVEVDVAVREHRKPRQSTER